MSKRNFHILTFTMDVFVCLQIATKLSLEQCYLVYARFSKGKTLSLIAKIPKLHVIDKQVLHKKTLFSPQAKKTGKSSSVPLTALVFLVLHKGLASLQGGTRDHAIRGRVRAAR